MPSSAMPEGTPWYVVVECTAELTYKGVALLTTSLEEARAMESELDAAYDVTAIVEVMRVYNS